MVKRKVEAGALAGLVGGLVSGVLLQLMPMTTPDGARLPAMTLVAGAVHAQSDLAGWVAYLIYAIVIGALFGRLLSSQEVGGGTALAWGGLYGAFWWIASSLLVVPALRGVMPFTPAAIDLVHGAAAVWLAAMIVDGVITGGLFVAVASLLAHRDAHGMVGEHTRHAA